MTPKAPAALVTARGIGTPGTVPAHDYLAVYSEDPLAGVDLALAGSVHVMGRVVDEEDVSGCDQVLAGR